MVAVGPGRGAPKPIAAPPPLWRMSPLISGARPMSNNYLLNMYEKALKLPAGRKLFSMVFSRKAPYFATITPTISELRPNFCEVTFKKRKGV
ncbi:MAG: DUF4442 domain-containing protein, partial [Alcanivorax sp.]